MVLAQPRGGAEDYQNASLGQSRLGQRRRQRKQQQQRLRLQTLEDTEVGEVEAVSTTTVEAKNDADANSSDIEEAMVRRRRRASATGTATGCELARDPAAGAVVAEGKRRHRRSLLRPRGGVLSIEEEMRTGGKGAGLSCADGGSNRKELSPNPNPGSQSADTSSTRDWRLAAGFSDNPPVMAQEPDERLRHGPSKSNAEEQDYGGVVDDAPAEDDRFMRMALRLAERARLEGEVPVRGAPSPQPARTSVRHKSLCDPNEMV